MHSTQPNNVSINTTSDLYACVAAEIEVKLRWVSDTSVNSCACGDVATLTDLIIHNTHIHLSYISTNLPK